MEACAGKSGNGLDGVPRCHTGRRNGMWGGVFAEAWLGGKILLGGGVWVEYGFVK